MLKSFVLIVYCTLRWALQMSISLLNDSGSINMSL